jgi:RNA polymerase sigma-70 factor (ECF subfamily)
MSEAAPTPLGDDDAQLRALMGRYQGGEMEAFEELYRRTLPMVRGYLGAWTRDAARTADLTQESYLQLHRSRRTYDARFPVRPWMLAIARHVRLSDERRLRRRASREVAAGEDLPEVPVPAEVEHLADRQEVARALAQLAPERREAVVLHHLQGLRFSEIGHIVGASDVAVRIRAHRGMAQLRELLAPRRENG